ncbi:pentatricopeptide repeat-containing protein [Tanacetum coccineum]|uniref:Pentatricopeptide repeat-containing protein n=1 Tax=Tanacetum coccineum TaxID=301880 RepID=A0ABQ5F098_9ASTR
MAPSGSRDAINISYEELVEWAEEEAQTTYVHNKFNNKVNGDSIQVEKVADKGNKRLNDDAIPVKKAVDKGKTKMVEDDHHVKKPVRRNKGIVIEENVNPSVMTVLQIVKLIQTLELTSLCIVTVIVSIQISQLTIYHKHEEFMDDLITKLKDEGDGIIDPFKIVESKVEKYRIHDVDTHWRIRKPQVGGKFVNVDQLKECLTYYALSNGFSLWFYTSSKTKLIAKCGLRPEKLKEQQKGKHRKWKRYPSTSTSEVEGSNCPWRCYGKEMTNEKSFQLNLEIKLHEIADLVMKKYKCIVSPTHCRNAKRWALNEEETTIEDHYGYIRSYGKILTAIGRGANNHIFLVAWAVVNVENKNNWSWFLDLHGDDLDMSTGNGLTLMSDQHKGLLEAVKEVMPHAKHRQCARHIYEGLLRPHAIAIIFKLNMRAKEYVPTCFKRQSFHASYHQYLTLVGEMTFWPDCSAMSRGLPPKPKKIPGRPRKKRIRAAHKNKSTTRNAPVIDEQVVDEPKNAPVIDEHSSQFEVGGFSDGRSNIHKASKRVNSKSNREGFKKRGKLAPGLRFSRLGSWFGLGQGQLDFDLSEALENAPTTQSSQITKDQGFPEQEQGSSLSYQDQGAKE